MRVIELGVITKTSSSRGSPLINLQPMRINVNLVILYTWLMLTSGQQRENTYVYVIVKII